MPEPSFDLVAARLPWTDAEQRALVRRAHRLTAKLARIRKSDPRCRTAAGQLAHETRKFLEGLVDFFDRRGWE